MPHLLLHHSALDWKITNTTNRESIILMVETSHQFTLLGIQNTAPCRPATGRRRPPRSHLFPSHEESISIHQSRWKSPKAPRIRTIPSRGAGSRSFELDPGPTFCYEMRFQLLPIRFIRNTPSTWTQSPSVMHGMRIVEPAPRLQVLPIVPENRLGPLGCRGPLALTQVRTKGLSRLINGSTQVLLEPALIP